MNNLQTLVIEQKVNGMTMENYIAVILGELEKSNIEKAECEMRVALLKQLNNRHKNIIDAQRVMIKEKQVAVIQ